MAVGTTAVKYEVLSRSQSMLTKGKTVGRGFLACARRVRRRTSVSDNQGLQMMSKSKR